MTVLGPVNASTLTDDLTLVDPWRLPVVEVAASPSDPEAVNTPGATATYWIHMFYSICLFAV